MSLRRILGSALLVATFAASAGHADPHKPHWKHDDHRDRDRHEHRRDRDDDDRRDFRREAEYREWKRQQARREAIRADREEAAYREWQRQQKARRQVQRGCPQGTVAVKGECLRPGHARRDYRVGEYFQNSGYNRVTNPGMYNLQQLAGSQYYSDNNSIYQVDSKTQKIMAVMNLMQMMQGMR